MIAREILDLQRRRPFPGLRVHLSDGTSYEVNTSRDNGGDGDAGLHRAPAGQRRRAGALRVLRPDSHYTDRTDQRARKTRPKGDDVAA